MKTKRSSDIPPTEASALVRWLQVHHKWISFLGALIVFTTYVVKEKYREDLKDFKDSLAVARMEYELRASTPELAQAVGVLLESVREVGKLELLRGGATDKSEALIDTLKTREEFFRNTNDTSRAQLQNVSRVLDVIPATDAAQKKLQQLSTSLKQQDDESQVIDGLLADIVKSGNISKKNFLDTHSRIDRAIDATEVVRAQTAAFCKATIDSATTKLRDSELSFKNSKTIGYALFAAGWLVGLLGTLLGIKGLEPFEATE